MSDLKYIEIASAKTADLAAIRSFYSSVGYGSGLNSDDCILFAIHARSVVAAARLSSEADTLVLRGMYVAESLRGRGVGSRLLERISAEIGYSACWCIPYAHLEGFYAQIGFRVCMCEEIPEFLMSRKTQYISAGREVTIMQRPEGGVAPSE